MPERSPVYKRRLNTLNDSPPNSFASRDFFEKSKMYIIPDQADIEYIQRLEFKESPLKQLSFNNRHLVEWGARRTEFYFWNSS